MGWGPPPWGHRDGACAGLHGHKPPSSEQHGREAKMQPRQRLASSSHSRSKSPFWRGRFPPTVI